MTTAISAVLLTPLQAIDPDSALESLDLYFETQTAKIERDHLDEIATLQDWNNKRDLYRGELREMLGISSLTAKSKLHATVMGSFKADGIVVERIHFQSLPGLYVTANLYRPAKQSEPLPGILYVCGHGGVKENGISYGNKVHYHHHGCWFARNGYVCLTIDTLQLGEIEGIHHGTYRYDRWWWLNKGYTPAGVEAWNCIRSLDYMETRKEIDAKRFGVTGRSGGGAYSWWIAAIDPRIQCAVPVAGITDLRNYVVDGCVEGHCDCMFMVNTFRWDYAKVAALVAPRPLLISNTDSDRIFPLDGVVRLHKQVRRIYELHGAGENLGLNITAGGHQDTQELRVHAFQWFNRHLKGKDDLIRDVASKSLTREQLKVFEKLPSDELNTRVDDSFVADAKHVEASVDVSQEQLDQIPNDLLKKTFAGWPETIAELQVTKQFEASKSDMRFSKWEFQSQQHCNLDLFLVRRDSERAPDLVVLNILNEQQWQNFVQGYGREFPAAFSPEALNAESEEAADNSEFKATRKMLQSFNWAMAYVAPRGVGTTAWPVPDKKRIQLRRRFYLLGQTLHGMQIYDIRRAINATKSLPDMEETQLWLQGSGTTATQCLYASLFEDNIYRLDLHQPASHHDHGPYLLNIDRICSAPQVATLASQRTKVVVYEAPDSQNGQIWQTVAKKTRESTRGSFQLRPAMKEANN